MDAGNTRARKANSAARNSRNRRSKDSLKVVYISNPMKVRTSASNFRSLVQQLTGKDSDISQYVDDANFEWEDDRSSENYSDSRQVSSSSVSREDSPAASRLDSFLPPLIDFERQSFQPEMTEEFSGGMFLQDFSDFFSPEFDFDALLSYDQILI